MKPIGWKQGAWQEFYSKIMINGRKRRVEWCDRVVTKRRGRLFDRRMIEEQMGSKRTARMR